MRGDDDDPHAGTLAVETDRPAGGTWYLTGSISASAEHTPQAVEAFFTLLEQQLDERINNTMTEKNYWQAVLAPLGVPGSDDRAIHPDFNGTRSEHTPVTLDPTDPQATVGYVRDITRRDGELVAILDLTFATVELLARIEAGELVAGFNIDGGLSRINQLGQTDVYTGRISAVVLQDPSLSLWPGRNRITPIA